MVWCHKRKIIFIHIPKTGGSSIETMLNASDKHSGYGVYGGIVPGKKIAFQHFRPNQYIKVLGKSVFHEYLKISVCRDPYSRFISEYYWCVIKGIGYRSNQSFDDFIEYAKNIVANKKYYDTIYHDHFIPQINFLFDENDKLIVDKLFRFEKFYEIEKYIMTLKGKQINKKCNETRIKKLIPTQKQKDEIYNMYKRDFELLGYKR